jgi:molybdopterin-guanine dinucleotide biosynthesis protein A
MGGAPKGLEIVGTERIIDRVAKVLRETCGGVILAANDEQASAWVPAVPVVRDIHPGAGGLAGVEAAIRNSGDVVVVAWDMPFVPATLLTELIRVAHTRNSDVVLPESSSPHGFEPFCAYYAARVLAPLSEFLTASGGGASDFLTTLRRAHRIPLRDVARFGDPATLFLSVNSRDDLARARALAATAG